MRVSDWPAPDSVLRVMGGVCLTREASGVFVQAALDIAQCV
jgi:hypothetical protein